MENIPQKKQFTVNHDNNTAEYYSEDSTGGTHKNEECSAPNTRKRRGSDDPNPATMESDNNPLLHWRLGTSFESRPSRLDFFDKDSTVSRSDYWGVCHAFLICGVYYVFITPLARLYEKNELFDTTLARSMFADIYFLAFFCVKVFFWTYTSFFAYRAYARQQIALTTLCICHALSLLVCVTAAVIVVIFKNWPFIPAGFGVVYSVIQILKMHSYVSTNLRYEEITKLPGRCPEYPDNLTLGNFTYFLCAPVIVYEATYPRTLRFRPGYFIKKVLMLIFILMVMYVHITTSIKPIDAVSEDLNFYLLILKFVFPLFFSAILIFFLIFECILNVLAEITNFGDRDFYHDWWNSTTFDEFARMWNRPIHEFLMRHVYLEARYRYKWRRVSAMILTFFISGLFHELVFIVCFRYFRPVMLAMIGLQVMLILLMQQLKIQGTAIGSIYFWFAVLIGMAFISACYCREWRRQERMGILVPPMI